MKTLTLIRHGKSARDNPPIPDHDRPLNERGRRDALALAGVLQHLGLQPDLFLASPARRCRQTVEAIARGSQSIAASLRLEPLIYEADYEALVALIQEKGGGARDLWLCGHNPGLADLFNRLSGSPLEKVPTCAFARLRFAMDDWEHLPSAKGQLVLFLTPRGMA